MTMIDYRPRLAERIIERSLEAVGGVVIEGPRAAGKTETARFLASSEILLDTDPQVATAMDVDPSLLLRGATPRLIDEWQIYPTIWNHVRREIDARATPGQFILTGSSIPADDITRHSGAGRIARVRLRPMTLTETGDSSGEFSLGALFAGESPHATHVDMAVDRIAELVAVGGWPTNLNLSPAQALDRNRGYLDEISRADVSRVDGVKRDPTNVSRLLRSVARNSATTASDVTLARDTAGSGAPIDDDTVRSYVNALERLMVVEGQPAWSAHLRSKATLRRAEKRHFTDPSLAVAALQTSPQRLVRNLKTLGFLFETLVVRDVRVYSELIDARVFHYRDSYDVEADLIVEDRAGRWAAFEVKLGTGRIDEAAQSLLKLRATVDVATVGELVALGVITGSGYSYRREDGVWVIPIGALGP